LLDDVKKRLVEAGFKFYLSKLGLKREARILDVGCGSGFYVYALKDLGFQNVLGVDMYIKEDVEYENGAKVIKGTLEDVEQAWDLILFNHSFEHLGNPIETLQKVSEMLSEGGFCFIRMPVFLSYAWERYNVNWVQLDAPRHYFIYAVETVRTLAEQTGLNLTDIVFDSSDFQFWASEQYLRNISLYSGRSYAVNPANSIFSRDQIETFKEKARVLNSENRGDQAAFYLAKSAAVH
jgi:SAM-dependent methyltransferase